MFMLVVLTNIEQSDLLRNQTKSSFIYEKKKTEKEKTSLLINIPRVEIIPSAMAEKDG